MLYLSTKIINIWEERDILYCSCQGENDRIRKSNDYIKEGDVVEKYHFIWAWSIRSGLEFYLSSVIEFLTTLKPLSYKVSSLQFPSTTAQPLNTWTKYTRLNTHFKNIGTKTPSIIWSIYITVDTQPHFSYPSSIKKRVLITYGMWDSAGMMAKGHAEHTFIPRAAPEMILKRMELMGSYGYARENNDEKYFRDFAILQYS